MAKVGIGGGVSTSRGIPPLQQFTAIKRRLRKIIKDIKDATPDAVVYGLQPIFDESQRLVPVDTGDLKASGYLEVVKSGGTVRAEVGYTRGGKPKYAGAVHERLDQGHQAPTQAKFLEHAVDKHINNVGPRIAEFLGRSAGLR